MSNQQNYLKEIITELLNAPPQTHEGVEKVKRAIARRYGLSLPRSSELLAALKKQIQSVQTNEELIAKAQELRNLLQIKKIRTLSGVTPVAIFAKPYPCPGQCVYCPDVSKVPKSYLPDEPAVMRAEANAYDPQKQIIIRLKQYQNIGHITDKIDLIIKGGSWSAYPPKYQEEFIRDCYATVNGELTTNDSEWTTNNDDSELAANRGEWATNNIKGKELTLSEVQEVNETAGRRIIGINVETRPDLINKEEIKRLRRFGVTKVELGVQSLDDEVLALCRRGHTVAETIDATKLLKDAGFKVGYHLMPNLPGSSPKKDLQTFKTVFADSRFRPDMLKIYPCVVTPHTQLARWVQSGKFYPYSDDELVEFLIECKKLLPKYVRVDRLGRDIPVQNIIAGYKKSNLREIVQKEMLRQGLKCRCIRCREIRDAVIDLSQLTLKYYEYPASGGREIFFMLETSGQLCALLRLRFTSRGEAVIRELHTYGRAVKIGHTNNYGTQHRGLGKRLIQIAEKACLKNGFSELKIISGVGVREYYRGLGYRLKGNEMEKGLQIV